MRGLINVIEVIWTARLGFAGGLEYVSNKQTNNTISITLIYQLTAMYIIGVQ